MKKRPEMKSKTAEAKVLDRSILEYLLQIPQGKVSTYKLLAESFQLHPRKIASVMKYNLFPQIYPCYKVVAHSGKISGYNTSRGVEEKIEKLQADGIEVIEGKINKKYFWSE